MTFCNDLEERLVWCLKASSRSLSAQELGAALGISGRRVGAIVSHLRRKPHYIPILSTSNEGYYWPRKLGDDHATLASIQSRINELEEVKEGVRIGMRREFGDPVLFDYEEAV